MKTLISRRRGLHTLIAVTMLSSAMTMSSCAAHADDPVTYALPGCPRGAHPSLERPDSVNFKGCGTGAYWLDDMSWTSWGPEGADGTGTYTYTECDPSCASGARPRLRVDVHADEPQAASPDAGCPANTQIYANLTLAYPDRVPDEVGGSVNEIFHGKPATLYSTAAQYSTGPNTTGPYSEMSLGTGSC